jgi:magnesium transporter
MSFRKRLPPVGARPGTLAIPADSPPPRIRLFDYSPDGCTELEVDDPALLAPFLESPTVTWVDVQGFGDEALLRSIAGVFGLHALTLEDATNVPQRAGSHVHSVHHLIVARAPIPGSEPLEVPQVCFILGRHYLLTFQDRYFGFFDPVRERIRAGIGPIRSSGPDYLAWALLDTLVDHYFPVLQGLSEDLEDLEDLVHENPDSRVLADLHRVRRALGVMRRVGWPQREALRNLGLGASPFFAETTLPYLRHVEQHAAQIMEAVDAARDETNGLIDIYLSNLSHRTNEVMKVLTLMASIFIPLTFLAGIYGMNFEKMPELRSDVGYPLVLGAMLVIAVGMVAFFRHRGWLGRRTPRPPGG